MGEMFVHRPNKSKRYSAIMHKDGNLENAYVENLCWRSKAYIWLYNVSCAKYEEVYFEWDDDPRPIRAYSDTLTYEFEDTLECGRFFGIKPMAIDICVNEDVGPMYMEDWRFEHIQKIRYRTFLKTQTLIEGHRMCP